MNETVQLLPPQHMISVSVLIWAVVSVLKTDTMGNWLNKLPPSWIGAIPRTWLPWIALILATALSVADLALTMPAMTWKDALAVAVQGLLSGAAAIAGHETLGKTVSKMIGHGPSILVLIFIGGASTACAPKAPPPQTAKEVAAEASYTSLLVTCVEKAKTLEESKGCRAKVDESLNIVQTKSALLPEQIRAIDAGRRGTPAAIDGVRRKSRVLQ